MLKRYKFLQQSGHLVVGDQTKSSEHLCNIIGGYKEAEQLANEIPEVTKLICITCLAGAFSEME
jgi:hypothetical protein